MTLQDIFDALSYGELSQMSIGGLESGEITRANRHRLLPHINMGMTALFKRFRLKEGVLSIRLIPDKTKYVLQSEYGTSVSTSGYIQDTGNPFTNDLLKIEYVLVDSGYELPLNDAVHMYSVQTPQTNVIEVPKAIVNKYGSLPEEYITNGLKVVYRANHVKLTYDLQYDYAYEDGSELELPEAYLPALLYFVASRVNNPMGMANEFHAGNSYYAKYEQECMRLEMENMQRDVISTSTRLERNGWV